MIKIADDFENLQKYTKNDVFSVRILSLYKAYGTKYDFVAFWFQTNDNEVTAIICRLDSAYTLSFNHNADIEELKEFVSLLGFSSLMCDDDFNYNCDFESGFVMSHFADIEVGETIANTTDTVPLNDVFRLNKDCLEGVDYDWFYTDMNHKIRHGVAKTYGVMCDSKVVSCAVVTSIYNKNAILSFVATDKKFQKRGFASQTIRCLLQCNDINCFLIRENHKNENFYNKLGFVNIGKWRIYKR